MRVEPASSEFSRSSFTTDAGRSSTSPAAIWLATRSERTCILPMVSGWCYVVSVTEIVVEWLGLQRAKDRGQQACTPPSSDRGTIGWYPFQHSNEEYCHDFKVSCSVLRRDPSNTGLRAGSNSHVRIPGHRRRRSTGAKSSWPPIAPVSCFRWQTSPRR